MVIIVGGGKNMLKNFVKKYGYYVLAFVLILVVGFSVGLSGESVSMDETLPDNSQQTSTAPLAMVCPMEVARVVKCYSDSELFYNSTLKQWESHRGVDLMSDASQDVVAVLDGTITESSYSFGNGYCLKISHQNGLETTYCSLKSNEGFSVRDVVSKGQKIGEAGNTASNESSVGGHLHFEVKLNGDFVDPSNYLTLDNK